MITQQISREEEDFLETPWEDCAFRRLNDDDVLKPGDLMWPAEPIGNMSFPGYEAPTTALAGFTVKEAGEGNNYFRPL